LLHFGVNKVVYIWLFSLMASIRSKPPLCHAACALFNSLSDCVCERRRSSVKSGDATVSLERVSLSRSLHSLKVTARSRRPAPCSATRPLVSSADATSHKMRCCYHCSFSSRDQDTSKLHASLMDIKTNSAFHPSGVENWGPVLLGRQRHPVKSKGHTLDIAPRSEGTSVQKRSGMARIV